MDIPESQYHLSKASIAQLRHYTPKILQRNFLNIWEDIRNYVTSDNDSDTMVCSGSLDGLVSCKRLYNRNFYMTSPYPWTKYIWSRYIPPRRSLLLWKILHNRLPKDDILKARGMILPSCCDRFCLSDEGNSNLIFWNCVFSKANWCEVFQIFGKHMRPYENFIKFLG